MQVMVKQKNSRRYLFVLHFIFSANIPYIYGNENAFGASFSFNSKYSPTMPPTEEVSNKGFRKGKDLIYEAMKKRTGIWPPQGKDLEKVVGGGLLEKQLISSSAFSHARENPDIAIRFESRGNGNKEIKAGFIQIFFIKQTN